MRLHLTDAAVRSLKAERQTKIWDASTPGFGILIGPRSKSWIVTHGTKRRTKVLGRYPDISLAAARLSAKKMMLAEPVPTSIVVSEGVARFLEDAETRTRARTSAGYRRLLTKYLIGRFGTRDLRCMTAQEIASIVDGLRRAPSEAAHVRTAISIFFTWCMGRSYADSNPARAIKAPGKKRARSKTLSDDELVQIWTAASDLTIVRIARLCIVLGQRRSEIAKLRWDWIDWDKRTITFPALVMKNNVEHTIPFGDLAEQIFAAIPVVSGHLFPGRDRNETWCGFARGKRDLDRASGVAGWTLHDLRRTYATNHARLGTPIHITEKLLGHISGTMGGIVGIYQRYNYRPEMAEATSKYETWLSALLSSAEAKRGTQAVADQAFSGPRAACAFVNPL